MTFDTATLDFDAIAATSRRKSRAGWWKIGVALAIAIVWLMPFWFLLTAIFKSSEEYARTAPLALPEGLNPLLANVARAWGEAGMGRAMANSAFYSIVGAGLAVFIAAMAAYALSRIEFPRRTAWFMVIFAGTVFPFQMYLIPLFFGFQSFSLLNTHLGMLLLYVAICIPFPTLVLRNFMMGLNREMDEAARMDGAREFTVFFRIILPNTIGPMTAVYLLQFTWIWNDLLFSVVLGNRPETRSIMNALLVFQGSYASAGPNIVLTAAFIASIPSIVLFFLLRKHFMEGLKV